MITTKCWVLIGSSRLLNGGHRWTWSTHLVCAQTESQRCRRISSGGSWSSFREKTRSRSMMRSWKWIKCCSTSDPTLHAALSLLMISSNTCSSMTWMDPSHLRFAKRFIRFMRFLVIQEPHFVLFESIVIQFTSRRDLKISQFHFN